MLVTNISPIYPVSHTDNTVDIVDYCIHIYTYMTTDNTLKGLTGWITSVYMYWNDERVNRV